MRTLKTLEQLMNQKETILYMIEEGLKIVRNLKRRGEYEQAKNIQIAVDDSKRSIEVISEIILKTKHVEQCKADITWYGTRNEPQNFDKQIEELEDYKNKVAHEREGLVEQWNQMNQGVKIQLED